MYSSLIGNLKDLSMFDKFNKARVMAESGMIKLNYIIHLGFYHISVTQGIEELLNNWSHSKLHWRNKKFENHVSCIKSI